MRNASYRSRVTKHAFRKYIPRSRVTPFCSVNFKEQNTRHWRASRGAKESERAKKRALIPRDVRREACDILTRPQNMSFRKSRFVKCRLPIALSDFALDYTERELKHIVSFA